MARATLFAPIFHFPTASLTRPMPVIQVNDKQHTLKQGQTRLGAGPGVDASQTGHPGKYTYCIAEYEAANPWEPLHVERGFQRDQNAVTVFAALAPHQISNQLSVEPEGVLTTMCANMRISAGTNRRPQYALVFPGEHQLTMKKAGWTREQVQNYCFENSRISMAELKRIHVAPGPITPEDEKTMSTLVETPQDFLVIAAGGIAGVQASYIPGWGGKNGSQSVTREIRKPSEFKLEAAAA